MTQLGCPTPDYHPLYMPCMYEDYENERICENYRNMSSKMAAMPVSGLLTIPMMERNRRHAYEPPPPPPPALPPQSSVVHVSTCGASHGVTGAGIGGAKRAGSSKGMKPAYKHVPHRDKPPHLVERRNARERRRVQAVNTAFARLRKSVPVENRNKRISKVKTLQKAIEYISYLEQVLADSEEEHMGSTDARLERHMSASSTVLNKENSQSSRWVTSSSSIGDLSCKEHNSSPYISPTYVDTYVQYPN